ncbi:RNA-guided endonuclease InsQ/TnpB family protein [Nonomuraea sp. NPDC047897]|uniref:RNA-guided endonuclease InsQ/TnpB family protein n=1 Tax=Nonomuraea sp. NPDC047897 TaxID=3364346 RepID=UPI00371A8B7B
MRRSFKFLLRPTSRQAAALTACLEDHRILYNAALEHRRTAYARAGVSVRYGDQSADLKHVRADDREGQGRWSFSSQQATLRRLDKAFRAFFDRVKAGRTPGFPRFKGRGWFDTVQWPKDGDGCRWDSRPEYPAATFVRLQGVGHVRVHRHRPVKGRVKTISVKREGSRWYVVLSCDEVPAQPLPATGAVARIANMTRSASGTIDAPGRNVAAKSGLNRSILDAGWGVFLTILAHKAESAGRELIAVDPRNTSRTCARCGHVAKDNRLTQAAFACTACGHTAHADVNAATNILRAGLALRQAAQAA